MIADPVCKTSTPGSNPGAASNLSNRLLPAVHCPPSGNPRDAARLAAAVLADVTVEKVIALHLTTKHRLIGVHVVSVGTPDGSLVHPREVFKAAFLSNAAGLILCHNHPSGDPTPSPDDRALGTTTRATSGP